MFTSITEVLHLCISGTSVLSARLKHVVT